MAPARILQDLAHCPDGCVHVLLLLLGGQQAVGPLTETRD